MTKKSNSTASCVFGYTIDDGSRNFKGYINELIMGVEGDILCNFSSKIEIPEEGIYIFFKSTNPVVVEAVFKGKVEFVGTYPIGTSRYVYRFITTEVIELGFLSNNKENNWTFVEKPKICS